MAQFIIQSADCIHANPLKGQHFESFTPQKQKGTPFGVPYVLQSNAPSLSDAETNKLEARVSHRTITETCAAAAG
jgi:hypothetical protein